MPWSSLLIPPKSFAPLLTLLHATQLQMASATSRVHIITTYSQFDGALADSNSLVTRPKFVTIFDKHIPINPQSHN